MPKNSEKFQTGDIVQLKSGGPKMTVVGYADIFGTSDKKTVRCQWFAGSKLESGSFPEDSLEVPAKDKK